MKNIYPKIDSKFRGVHALKKYIDKYKGVEIQLLSLEEKENTFSFEEEIRIVQDLFPNIKEITVHPPTFFCDIEKFFYKKDILLKQLEMACTLSEELGIHINMLYHANWSLDTYKRLLLYPIKEMLNQIRGYDVYILLENTYSLENNNEKGNNCTPLELCKLLGEKQLKVCLDICHVHVCANILEENIEIFIEKYLKKEDASKYVYQIHFAYAGKDGYKEKSTHGTLHPTRKELEEDITLLYKYGMYNCNFITEIREKNYEKRDMQVKEIEMLEDIYEIMK